jgi:NADH-quinone oxidoreductase subunit L
MTVPQYVLAAGAVGIGFLAGPATHWYGHYLENSPSLSHAGAHAANITMMVLSTVLALVGIFVAWSMYGKTERAPYTADSVHGPAYNFSLKALYFDELYLAFVVRPIRALAELSELIDRLVIDKLVDAVGFIPIVLGSILRPIQGGFVQSYALIMLVGLAFCLVGVLRALAAM